MSDGIVKDIDRGRGEVLRIEVSEFKGKKNLNLRIWYTDKEGELKPTQKGVTISPEQYDELKEAIIEAGSMF